MKQSRIEMIRTTKIIQNRVDDDWSDRKLTGMTVLVIGMTALGAYSEKIKSIPSFTLHRSSQPWNWITSATDRESKTSNLTSFHYGVTVAQQLLSCKRSSKEPSAGSLLAKVIHLRRISQEPSAGPLLARVIHLQRRFAAFHHRILLRFRFQTLDVARITAFVSVHLTRDILLTRLLNSYTE